MQHPIYVDSPTVLKENFDDSLIIIEMIKDDNSFQYYAFIATAY